MKGFLRKAVFTTDGKSQFENGMHTCKRQKAEDGELYMKNTNICRYVFLMIMYGCRMAAVLI